MWKKLRPFLVDAKLHPIRVENPIHPGTPDVNVVNGAWIELKSMEAWPVKPTTVFRIPHYTPQQRVWLYERWRAGGACFLLLEVQDEWFLYDGDFAAQNVGRCNRVDHKVGARFILKTSELSLLPAMIARR